MPVVEGEDVSVCPLPLYIFSSTSATTATTAAPPATTLNTSETPPNLWANPIPLAGCALQALDSVMNAECAVRSVGFFGPEGEGVYCCTNTETLSLWHAAGAQRMNDFGDIRALARGEPQTDSEGRDAAGAKEEGGAAGPAAAAAAAGGKAWGVAVDCIVGCQV